MGCNMYFDRKERIIINLFMKTKESIFGSSQGDDGSFNPFIEPFALIECGINLLIFVFFYRKTELSFMAKWKKLTIKRLKA